MPTLWSRNGTTSRIDSKKPMALRSSSFYLTWWRFSKISSRSVNTSPNWKLYGMNWVIIISSLLMENYPAKGLNALLLITKWNIHYSSLWALTIPTHISEDIFFSWIYFPSSIDHSCLSHRKNARGTSAKNKSRKTTSMMKWFSPPKMKIKRPLIVGAPCIYCTHCNIIRRTKEKCWKLHGYSLDFKFCSKSSRHEGASTNQVSTNNLKTDASG